MASPVEQVMDFVRRIPLGGKVAIVLAIAGGLTAGNYFLFVSSIWDDTNSAIAQSRHLEDEMIEDKATADNLPVYRRQKELLEQKLKKALTEMPEQANIPEIIESVYATAQKAGLSINTLEPKAERRAQFYAEIPFQMSATGAYPEIAVFFDALRHLKRIVNVANLDLKNPRMKNDKIIVDAAFSVTTFSFLPAPPAKKGRR